MWSKLGCISAILVLCCIISTVESSKCKTECNLALASYTVPQGTTLTVIANYFNVSVDEILAYNKDEIPNKDFIKAGIKIDIPFPCGCVNDSFLGHIFSYVIQKGDTYDKVAMNNYTNLTTGDSIQAFNSYPAINVPDGALISVPVNCSCGDPSVSEIYGLFVTYPLRDNDSLSSVSKEFNVSQGLLQRYNAGVDFGAGSGVVFVPGKDKNGTYPPFASSGSAGAGLPSGAIAGICIAAVVAVAVLAVVLYLKCGRRKKIKEASLLSVTPEYQLTHIDSIGHAGHVTGFPGVTVDKLVEYSYQELAKTTDNFSLSCKIGEGGFGAVYYAELRGEQAAIKKMDMEASREFLAELKVLTHVHHLNLVRLLGYCVEGSLFLVYEFIDNGNLSQHLRNSGRDPLPWSTRVQIALDSARALEYIHEHTVPVYVHRDIKPANILITKNFQTKVADFGLAKLAEVGNATLPTRLVGTFGYMPPEYAQFGEVTPKVDVYAFGVVLYELISAKEAVLKGNRAVTESKGLVGMFEEILERPDPNEICQLVDPRLGDDYPLDAVRQVAELAKACTHENHHLRPSMRSVVVALTTLSSKTENWDIDSFYGNGGLLNRISGR